MDRPAVDVVVPFAGTDAALRRVLDQLRGLRLRPTDTATVVDNRPGAHAAAPGPGDAPRVIRAGSVRSSYFARNRGAAEGSSPWLLFIDADVAAPPGLADAYFETPPRERTAVLAGGVQDRSPAGGAEPLAVRYAALRHSMSQANTLAGDRSYAQTANCAVRRSAFEEIGGFEDRIRSGGDADLCFRAVAAGWNIERREAAAVVHLNRETIFRMLAQRARHGAGAQWLERRYPGAFPRRRPAGLALWSIRRAGGGLRALAARDGEGALLGLLDPPAVWAYELGRLLPNGARGPARP